MSFACKDAEWCPANDAHHNSLRRVHLTCLTCRARRMFYGKMPKTYKARPSIYMVNGNPYLLLRIVGRRFERIKDILIDLVLTTKIQNFVRKRLSIAEFLAN